MSSLPITPPSKARVDLVPKSSSPPTGSPGIGDFAALLSQTKARTAPAEGQQTRPARTQERRRDDDGAPARRTEAKDDNSSPVAQAQQGDASTQPATDASAPSTSGDGQQAAGQDAQAQDQDAAGQQAGGRPGDAQNPAVPAAAPMPQAQSAPIAGADGAPAGATAGEQGKLTAAVGQAAEAAGQPVVTDGALPADGTPAGQLQIPAELLAGKALGKLPRAKDPGKADGAQGDLPPLPTLPPSASAAAVATTSGGTGDAGSNNPNNTPQSPSQPQPQAGTPAPTAAVGQPTATPLAAMPAAAGSAQLTRASLAQTTERVQELVRIAATRGGNARATLQLKPEALGQVDVQLRTTKDGLVATIAAHDQAGLDALKHAAAELRRTLEDRGVQLHSLDLQLGAGADSGFGNQRDARDASTGRSGQAASYDLDDGDAAGDEVELTITRSASIPAGELVDVTA